MIKKIAKSLAPLIVLAALITAGICYWHHNTLYPSTDDAYVKAHVINVTPQISGNVKAVFVQDHQLVKAGDLLFTVDPQPYRIAVDKAQAQLDSTKNQIAAAEMAVTAAQSNLQERKAELIDARADTHRTLLLVKQHYESQSDGDMAIKNLHVAEAAVDSAKAQLKEAEQQRGELGKNNSQLRAAQAALADAQLDSSYTNVYAPANGHIANFSLRPGDKVSAYNPVFALIEDHTWWVDANFKETQLARLQPGESANVVLDMYPGKTFTGTVSSISDGSGTSFSLLPPENASGNWVKTTQRFPVKILLTDNDKDFPLRLDASATVTVNTHTYRP